MQGYRFQGITIAVTSDDPALLGWLGEFLAPGFEPWDGATADFAVHVLTAPAHHAALAATRPAGPLPERPCFALDQDVVHHPSWTASGRTVLADTRLGALYRLGDREVDVIAAPGWLRTAALRVVREIAATRALADGQAIQLHAAVLERGGRALAIAGPKGAGKTTVLCYLAAASGGGVRVVTNDRAIGVPARAGGDDATDGRSGSGFEVLGVPTLVSVRPQTLVLLPRLAGGVPDVERPGHLTLREFDAALAERGQRREPPQRLKLSPPQLARLLGAPLAARARLGAIVFPEPADRSDSFVVERLDPGGSARRLPGMLFGVQSGKSDPTVFESLVGASRPADADGRGLEALAAGVPCFSLRIGRACYESEGAARSILARCLEP